ncbi:hypothetical protein AB0H43_20455 [Hamadaea sp. NPDC050747]|uniref:hypothetical protein n=1 Tax=Hamadaea sp. NPDC050747 TaxID=3155789 RepID=UPI0033CEC2FF
MTNANGSGEAAGQRKNVNAAIQAALWTVSNGRCYAPGCPMPVVLEVRPGVYQKNAQVAHIYGVKPGAPRFRRDLDAAVRDSFANLLLLCLAHHEEVDGKEGETRYPPEVLLRWKREHEGAQGSVLQNLPVAQPEFIMKVLVHLAEPPLRRLEAVADHFERTGKVTTEALAELRRIIAAMSDIGIGVDARIASQLTFAAEVFSNQELYSTAKLLAEAAETLPYSADRLETAIRSAGQFM